MRRGARAFKVAKEEFYAVRDSLVKVADLSRQINVNDLHRTSMRRRGRWVTSHFETRARREQRVIARRLKGGSCECRIRSAAWHVGERKRRKKYGEEEGHVYLL